MLILEIWGINVVSAPIARRDLFGNLVEKLRPRIGRADVEIRREWVDLFRVSQHRPDRFARVLGKANHKPGDDANAQFAAHLDEPTLLVVANWRAMVFLERLPARRL